MKRNYFTVLALIFTLVFSFSACKISEPAKKPENTKPQVVEEKNEETTESVTDEKKSSYEKNFTVGDEYETTDFLIIRKEPVFDAENITADEIAEEDKDNVSTDGDIILKAGSTVKCVEVKNDWMKIPSGWVRIEEPGEYPYIVYPGYKERINKYRDNLSKAVDGTTDYQAGKSGKYLVESNDITSLDTITLYDDGRCLARCKLSLFPETDENGYTTGWYVVKGDKIYILYGGRSNANECSIDGDRLVFTNGKEINTVGIE